MADKYILRVTAGSGYDLATQTEVPVNIPQPVKISNKLMDIDLNVRIQNYRGLPRDSPSTSPYFTVEPHAKNGDQYSISFRLCPKDPRRAGPDTGAKGPGSGQDGDENDAGPPGISAADLQFGNDFDHPIRDRLPPGFNTAMNIVKWWIDPGLDGDAYADEPYLYGPALSSFNTVHVGSTGKPNPIEDAEIYCEANGGLFFHEGGDDNGLEARRAVGAPDDAKARMKWALRSDSKKAWVWEYGRTYAIDFFNPYLDFSEFAVRLPGFNIPIMKYWDGQSLRYVLRNRSTNDVYLVVLFSIYRKEDVTEDGAIHPDALANTNEPHQSHRLSDEQDGGEGHESVDEIKVLEEARRHLEDEQSKPDTSIDDVD